MQITFHTMRHSFSILASALLAVALLLPASTASAHANALVTPAYANTLQQSANVFTPANALGAADGSVATFDSNPSFNDYYAEVSLDLDMGIGQEGTSDLRIYYSGLSENTSLEVYFYNDFHQYILVTTVDLADTSSGIHSVVASYPAGNVPYRYVALYKYYDHALDTPVSLGIDAVEALAYVESATVTPTASIPTVATTALPSTDSATPIESFTAIATTPTAEVASSVAATPTIASTQAPVITVTSLAAPTSTAAPLPTPTGTAIGTEQP